MTRKAILVLAEREQDAWVLRAPAVGIWSRIPREGVGLRGRNVGLLTQGTQRLRLLLPDDVGGSVHESPADRCHFVAVEWGQTLLRLADSGAAGTTPSVETGGSRAAAGGAIELRAPTDGVFYHRPTPGAAPFVAPGDTIRFEQAIGLIEVMKTFTQVLYEGHGLPDPAVIEEILVGDGVEVRSGEPLLRVKKA